MEARRGRIGLRTHAYAREREEALMTRAARWLVERFVEGVFNHPLGDPELWAEWRGGR